MALTPAFASVLEPVDDIELGRVRDLDLARTLQAVDRGDLVTVVAEVACDIRIADRLVRSQKAYLLDGRKTLQRCDTRPPSPL